MNIGLIKWFNEDEGYGVLMATNPISELIKNMIIFQKTLIGRFFFILVIGGVLRNQIYLMLLF